MPKAEILQTAAQFAGQARELFDAGARTNLLQNLTVLGHPYGLMLSQSSGSSESFFDVCFPPAKGEAKANIKDVGPIASLSFSAESSSGPLLSLGLSSQDGLQPFWSTIAAYASMINSSEGTVVSSDASSNHRGEHTSSEIISIPFAMSKKNSKDMDQASILFGIALAMTFISKAPFKISAQKDADFARKLHWENVVNQQTFLAPILLKLLGRDNLFDRPRELKVGKHSVSLGTTAIKLATYKGEQPFVVKTPQGEPLAQINPGDQLGHLHVSHQAGLMRGLSPLEKAEQITGDFMDLLKVIDYGSSPELNEAQQKTLARVGKATIIGISHLVRLFRHRTGLPTWKLNVLPELVQRFHQHDSQAVSNAFGGTRKVKPTDVEMMVVTPAMRQQLVAQNL